MQHHTGSFRTSDALTLYTQHWLPEAPQAEVRACVVLAHGYAEHSSRYAHVAEQLTANGYALYAFDCRGHGKSDGERANVDVFREFVMDLGDFTEHVRQSHPNVPRFLLGHSMGGMVALQLVLEHPEKVDGLILSAAYVQNAADVPPLLLRLSRLVSHYFPSLPVQELNTDDLSRDDEVVRSYKSDPLIYHGKVKARLGAELLNAGPYVLARADYIHHLPLFVMHGDADKIASSEGSQALFDTVTSDDKTLKLYPGFYHELFNEPEEGPLEDTLEWLEQQMSKDSASVTLDAERAPSRI